MITKPLFPSIHFFGANNPFFWVRACSTQSPSANAAGIQMTVAFQSPYLGGNTIPLFNRFCYSAFYSKLLSVCKREQLPYLVDIDDLFWELPGYSKDEANHDPHYRKFLFSLCSNAHGIIASTPFLCQRLHEQFPSRSVYLVENCPPNWYAPAGSALIANTDSLKLSTENVVWFTTLLHELWGQGVGIQLVGENEALTSSWFEPYTHSLPRLSYNDYLKYLQCGRFSVGMIPVEESSYANAKSAIKIMEFLNHGIPVIASDTIPHRQLAESHPNLPIQLVKNTEADWRNAVLSFCATRTAEQKKLGTSINALLYEARCRQLAQWTEVYRCLPVDIDLCKRNLPVETCYNRQRTLENLMPFLTHLRILFKRRRRHPANEKS